MLQSVLVACIGLAGVLMGQGLNLSQGRRQSRAELITAQRNLARSRRLDLEDVADAANEVERLGFVAGVPRWLNRRYRDVTVAEARIRREIPDDLRHHMREEVGEVEFISHLPLIEDAQLQDWGRVADEYRWTAEIFTEAVWRPWRSRLKMREWKTKASQFEHYKIFTSWAASGE